MAGSSILAPRAARPVVDVSGKGFFWTNRGYSLSGERMRWNRGVGIAGVTALEVLDSRGNPTVEAEVALRNGIRGRAIVPSGASTGQFEALELRDKDPGRFLGKGTLTAVRNIEEKIAPAIAGRPVFEQDQIDKAMIELDGTPNKANLGANAILAVSLAVARAAANAAEAPLYGYIGGSEARVLPVPMCNTFNGGAHGEWVTDLQEFMLMPVGARTFADGIRMASEVYQHVGKILIKVGYGKGLGRGNEGGFNPYIDGKYFEARRGQDFPVRTVDAEVLYIFCEAIIKAGYVPGVDMAITQDGAVTDLEVEPGVYEFKREGIRRTSAELTAYFGQLIAAIRGPKGEQVILSIEDSHAEEDWAGWQGQNRTLGGIVQVVGDDLFVTNTTRIARGIKEAAANSVLIKVNQIGTLTETLRAIRMAHQARWTTVISHRSGETEDTFIADLAVATGSGQIKTGATSYADRIGKYNRLLRIGRELGSRAIYPGFAAFTNREVHAEQFPG